MNLISVYDREEAAGILYDLLSERNLEHSISHKRMPCYEEHVAFIRSEPYAHWYLIEDAGYLGSIYLTKQREVGLFLFMEHQGKGYGAQAVELLRALHPGRLLANVNPANERSIRFFERLGFEQIQATYELR
jgi:RimJ/RimL family protein N-acetyltransferase